MHCAPRSSDKRPMGTTFKNTPAVLGSLPASTRIGRSTVLWSVARLRRGAGPGGRRPGVRGWVVCVCVCVCVSVCVSFSCGGVLFGQGAKLLSGSARAEEGQITCLIINPALGQSTLCSWPSPPGHGVLTILRHQDGHTELMCRPKFTSRSSQRQKLEKPDWHTSRNQHSRTGLAMCIVVTGLDMGTVATGSIIIKKEIGPSPHQANHTQQNQ